MAKTRNEGEQMSVAAASTEELSEVEAALLEAIKAAADPRPSTVIPQVVAEHADADVRGAYWRLISRNRVSRALNGRLTVVGGH